MKPRWRIALCALLVLGGTLRTIQYGGQVSLWHDELAIARNIEDRDVRGLTARPLDHRQVAPAGFLVAVKVSTQILGANELGLRFVSWLAGLLALPLFWRVAARFASGGPLLAGVAIFAVSPALLWYGATVKQYGTDLTVSLFLVWLALRVGEHPERLRRAVTAGVAGGAAILLSHPAVVTAFVLGCVLAVSSTGGRWRAPGRAVVLLGGGWGAGALVAAASAMALLDPATDGFMKTFWREGFPPSFSQPLALLTWIPRQGFSAFAHFLIFLTPLPLVLLLVVPLAGLAVLALPTPVRLYSWKVAMLSAPIIAGPAAAVIGLLPFHHRLALHAVWPILVFAMIGLQRVEGWLRPKRPRLGSAVAPLTAAPFMLIVLIAARPPYDSGQETRPVIEELARRWKAGDGLYVYCGARHAVSFYGPRHGLYEWTASDCNYDNPRVYLREVDAFRGRSRIGREEEVIAGHALSGRGGRIIDVYRYDLSTPAAGVTAAEFKWPTASTSER